MRPPCDKSERAPKARQNPCGSDAARPRVGVGVPRIRSRGQARGGRHPSRAASQTRLPTVEGGAGGVRPAEDSSGPDPERGRPREGERERRAAELSLAPGAQGPGASLRLLRRAEGPSSRHRRKSSPPGITGADTCLEPGSFRPLHRCSRERAEKEGRGPGIGTRFWGAPPLSWGGGGDTIPALVALRVHMKRTETTPDSTLQVMAKALLLRIESGM